MFCKVTRCPKLEAAVGASKQLFSVGIVGPQFVKFQPKFAQKLFTAIQALVSLCVGLHSISVLALLLLVTIASSTRSSSLQLKKAGTTYRDLDLDLLSFMKIN